MKSVIYGVIFSILNSIIDVTHTLRSSSCGRDRSLVSTVYEGVAALETYPWIGMLYYPMEKKRFTTSVVLVTKQMVIAAASEIDKLPKWNFRARTRVVLGQNCRKENEIRVREYSYHPEYQSESYSALAIVQLEVDHLKRDLVPICPPSSYLIEPQFYAMTMSDGCSNPIKVRIHKMQYVNINRCEQFYRRSGLGQDSLWPTHTTCARSVSGGRCLWRSGSLLAVKHNGRWRLMGFSVYGPGCGAPARFLDYGGYQPWVRRSAASVGRPAVSRLAGNHLVMRRTFSSVQRFGPCNSEETKFELYTDKVQVLYGAGNFKTRYNVTIYDSVEYSCIVFKARTLTETDFKNLGKEMPPGSMVKAKEPHIRLRRWCTTPTGMCYGFQHLQIQFYVEINFSVSVEFHIAAYGKEAKIISPETATKYANKMGKYPVIYKYDYILNHMKIYKSERTHYWFLLEDITKKAGR